MTIEALPTGAMIDNSLGHFVILAVPDEDFGYYAVAPVSLAHQRTLTPAQFAHEFPAQAITERAALPGTEPSK